MAYRFRKDCKTCQIVISEDPAYLKSRLYKLVNDVHLKKMKLTHVSAEYPQVTYASLSRHAKRHQHPSPHILANKAKHEAEMEAKADIVKKIKSSAERRSDLIEKLHDEFEAGNIKGTLAGLVQLERLEVDIEEKQKDRTLEVFKMMAKFQSGELENRGTRRITEDSNPGV